MPKLSIISGIVFSVLSVAIGAFGAHSLQQILESNNRVDTFETAVKYQMFHALALLFTGLFHIYFKQANLNYAIYLFIIGIIIFSGSLYILSITNIKWLGAITPIGGLAFIAAWIVLLFEIIKIKI